MMGVCNRVGTAQEKWNWANITGGAGTDSIMWSYAWGADSLILGENFVCCVPLEDQAATTNNLGLGTPFAGNLEVYPLYRMSYNAGAVESSKPQAVDLKLGPTIIRGVLRIGDSRQSIGYRSELLDAAGRRVMSLQAGANDVSGLAPGVYFLREEAQAQAVRKIVITK
jgi:hypothetical protein